MQPFLFWWPEETKTGFLSSWPRSVESTLRRDLSPLLLVLCFSQLGLQGPCGLIPALLSSLISHFSLLHSGPEATRALGSSWRGTLALPPRTHAHGAPSHLCALLPPPHTSPASLLCFIRSYISQHFPEKAWV